MGRIKSWLKSWIFWLIVTVILLALFIFLLNGWKVGDDWLFALLILMEAAIIMLLLNASKENLMKISLTVLVFSLAVLLLFVVSGALDIEPDFFVEILVPLLFVLIIPS
ncbi:hypothetical protein J6V86_03060 [bacterium]|nr:hypothetical protein [bacterium]